LISLLSEDDNILVAPYHNQMYLGI
jgi:hypothetical protein